MKTKLLFTLLVAFGGIMKAQVPNGDFANWTALTNYDMPADWDNLNPMTASQNVFTCLKGLTKSTGNVYLKLVSDSVPGMGVAPGIAVCGKLDPMTLKPKSGFSYTQRPTALTGQWQFMAQGTDPGFVAVYFSKWNNSTKKREIIGSGVDTLKGMEMAWAPFSVPITFSSQALPDSCIIFLSSSGPTPLQYSYLFVDDLKFETTSGITENQTAANNFSYFPNPAHDILKLDLHSLKNVQSIQIVDIQGQVLYSSNAISMSNEIDVSKLTPGMYFIDIKSESGLSIKKFDKF